MGLVGDQLFFLLALREIESGSERNEFNIKAVSNTSLDKQADVAIQSILENERRWLDYIRDIGYIDYTDYFACYGGPLGTGWHNVPIAEAKEWARKLEQLIEEVENEFERNSRMGSKD
jgi:hypothetical protein